MDASYDELIAPHLLNSRLKLHLLLHYLAHSRLCISAAALSERLRENPWDVAEALNEMAEMGLLVRCNNDGPARYTLTEEQEHSYLLQQLVEAFNDPLAREHLYARVRDIHRDRQFYRWAKQASSGLHELVIG